MEKKSYIVNRFKNILNETLDKRAEEVLEKLNLNKETPFRKPGMSADYVEEAEVCERCGGYKGGEMVEGEMCECGSMNEELKGGQKKLDVAKPYGKLTRSDFEKLRKGVKKHMKKGETEKELDESWYSHDEYYRMRDEDDEDKLRAYQDELVSGGKKDETEKELDESWYSHDEYDRMRNFNLGDKDYEDNEDKLQAYQDELVRGGKKDETEKLYDVEFDVEMEEGETYEGNAFTGALAKAKKEGDDEFKVGGKEYKVSKKDKVSVDETYYKVNVDGEFALFTEEEMITLIEDIVKEEKVKNNIKNLETPKGMSEYERVHKADKKEEDQYFKDLAKKMKDYTKNMEDEGSKYEMKETKKFPTENGGMKKGNRKKYTPSDAVDEYVEAFSYPGQTNLRYDEIKPNDEWIEANLKGSSKTGNAQVDEDGNALGNVVPSKTGEKFYKNYEENLYGHEQADASYKRYSQPVDVAGDKKEIGGSLKSKRGKKTAQSVLNKLEESTNDKTKIKLNEEFNRIQSLMGYNRKTQ